MDMQALNNKSRLTVHEAAQLTSADASGVKEMEKRLAHAIDRGELPADIVRWSSEQWDGGHLDGNIDRTRTMLNRDDLNAWLVCQRGM